jgi:hypothetical protein
MPVFVAGLSPHSSYDEPGGWKQLTCTALPSHVGWSIACCKTKKAWTLASFNSVPRALGLLESPQAVVCSERWLVYLSHDEQHVCLRTLFSEEEDSKLSLSQPAGNLIDVTTTHVILTAADCRQLMAVALPTTMALESPSWPAIQPLPPQFDRQHVQALSCGKEHIMVLLGNGRVVSRNGIDIERVGAQHCIDR